MLLHKELGNAAKCSNTANEGDIVTENKIFPQMQ